MIQVAIQTRSPRLDVEEYVDLSNGNTRLIVMHASIIVADFRYQQCADMIQLGRFKVAKAVRRRGIGKAIIEHIQDRGLNIDARLSERELGGQLFLSACGFRVVAVLDGDDGDDDYLFRWEAGE